MLSIFLSFSFLGILISGNLSATPVADSKARLASHTILRKLRSSLQKEAAASCSPTLKAPEVFQATLQIVENKIIAEEKRPDIKLLASSLATRMKGVQAKGLPVEMPKPDAKKD